MVVSLNEVLSRGSKKRAKLPFSFVSAAGRTAGRAVGSALVSARRTPAASPAVQPWNLPGAAQRAQDRMVRDINASFTPEQRRALANLPRVTFGGTAAPATGAAQTPPQYSPTLPSLTADEELYFNLAADEALRGRQRATNVRAEELGRLGLWATQEENRLRRQGYQAGRSLRDELSGSGLGFSPMFVNRGMRAIAGEVASARANVAAQRAAREEALSRAVQQAEDAYRSTLSRIELERRMRQSGRAVGNIGG